MNVTPLIDVLLVLIIIFLVVMPSLSHGLKTSVPETSDQKPAAPRDDIVVTVVGNGTVRLNQESVALEDLDGRLKAVFKNAANHAIFVRADKDLDFQQIADMMNKDGGIDRVALMGNKAEARSVGVVLGSNSWARISHIFSSALESFSSSSSRESSAPCSSGIF
jgi:biopolymer transport protein ExbD